MTRLENAFDRGSAAAYYGRHLRPQIWLDPLGIEVDFNLTSKEIAAWRKGYRAQNDRKEYE